jgi:hypothetical protein
MAFTDAYRMFSLTTYVNWSLNKTKNGFAGPLGPPRVSEASPTGRADLRQAQVIWLRRP